MVLIIVPAALHFGPFSASCPLVCIMDNPPPMQSNYHTQNNIVKMCPLAIQVGDAIIERLYKYAQQVTHTFSIALSHTLWAILAEASIFKSLLSSITTSQMTYKLDDNHNNSNNNNRARFQGINSYNSILITCDP